MRVSSACKEKIVEMVMNRSGTRDTGRILGVSKDTVTAVLKTKEFAKPVNEEHLLKNEEAKQIDIVICNALGTENHDLSVEMDEMWSYYHDKAHQLWLRWAIDH